MKNGKKKLGAFSLKERQKWFIKYKYGVHLCFYFLDLNNHNSYTLPRWVNIECSIFKTQSLLAIFIYIR